ncbi:hypothetical protein SeLEV6574_g03645 [Synchytrium endobioticum]|uniref:histidine kinase n=1 Tax=Synchytrium endobioticum TaxID=286115 RepID=A0A507D2R4_9FUNG|nr:hypothetical protein SeLEV6574_g03645 [Synchytrium endobioticum]
MPVATAKLIIWWCLLTFAASIVTTVLIRSNLIVLRLGNSVLVGAAVCTYVKQYFAKSLGLWIVFQLALIVCHLCGELAFENADPSLAVVEVWKITNCILLAFFLILLCRPRTSDGKLLLDTFYSWFCFVAVTIITTGLCGVLLTWCTAPLEPSGFVEYVNAHTKGWDSYQFFEYFTAEGLLVVLPTILLLNQHKAPSLRIPKTLPQSTIYALALSLATIAVPFFVMLSRSWDHSNLEQTGVIAIAAMPFISLSGVVMSTAGLTLNLFLLAIATPIVQRLVMPWDQSTEWIIAFRLILGVLYLSIIPFLVVLNERDKILANIEKTVVERTEQLRLANEEKTRFINFLCHELRNPLHVIVGISTLELENHPCTPNEFAETVSSAAQYMSDLCSDVLDAAKLSANKVNIQAKWCDVSSIMSSICKAFAYRARSLGITLEYHADDHIPEVYTDDLRWRQCLTNLLVNSCRFTPAGGKIDVYLKMLDDPSVPPDHVKLSLAVVDTGIGIPETSLPTLFQPFSVTSELTSREYQGSGLGLSLVSMMVELLGGRVFVKSKVNSGSNFWFELLVPCRKTATVMPAVETPGHHTVDMESTDVQFTDMTMLSRPEALRQLHGVVSSNNDEPVHIIHLDVMSNSSAPNETRSSLSSGLCNGSLSSPKHSPYIATIPPMLTDGGGIANDSKSSAESGVSATKVYSILIVDDSDVNRRILAKILQKLEAWRFEIRFAADGQEAVDVCVDRFDLILMDIQMPRLDGIEATARIRKEGANMRTPIVVTSASNITLEQTISQGFSGLLTKPFSSADVSRVLSLIL